MTKTSLPSDYEACGQCGFDHAYEPSEAYKWHFDQQSIPQTLKIYCVCGEDYKLASGESLKCDCGETVTRRAL